MRHKISKTLSILVISLLSFSFIACSDDDDNNISNPIEDPGTAKVRVIHMSYDAPAVDIRVDGNVAISNLGYGATSGYAEIEEGTRNIQVVPTGASEPVVIDATLPIILDQEYTIIAANNLANIQPIVLADNRSVNTSKAKVRFVHASPDAPAVDIKLNDGNGAVVFDNTSFAESKDYVEVDAGTYNFAVTANDDTKEVVILGNVPLENGTLYTVVARGTLDANDNVPFEVRTFVDNGNGDAFVDLTAATSKIKVIHASPDAPGVDLLVDNGIVGTNLTFPNNTGYLTLNSGTKNIKVNVTGTSTTAIEADLLLSAFTNYSVFAVDLVSNITPLVVVDNLEAPASGNSHLRFLHLSPDAPAVDVTLSNGTVTFNIENVSFKGFTDFTPLVAGTYDIQVKEAGTDTVVLDIPQVTFNDGTIYSVFAKGLVSGSGDQQLNAEIIVNGQ
jgi:hypothetical protein